jgi:hypothetical protein
MNGNAKARMAYEARRTEMTEALHDLEAQIEAMDSEAHIAEAKAYLTEQAKRGAPENELADAANKAKLASLGTDDFGARRTILEAKATGYREQLAALEEVEQGRLRRLAAAQILAVGEMLNKAKASLLKNFNESFKTHCILAKLVDVRLDLQATLSGRPKGNSCGATALFAFPEVGDGRFGEIVPRSEIALGYSDAAYKRIVAEVAEELAAQLEEVPPVEEHAA